MQDFKVTFVELKKYNATTRKIIIKTETFADAERLAYELYGKKYIFVLQIADENNNIVNPSQNIMEESKNRGNLDNEKV